MPPTPSLIVLLGPTAGGKTRLAAQLAARMNGEIISADSRQVYRDMNIGTGKDYEDYIVDNQRITYHLIDIINAGENYHIAQFQRDFWEVYVDILKRNKTPILCGGSGMYLDAVLQNYEYTQVPVDEVLREELEQKSYEELEKIFRENPSSYSALADCSTKKRLIRAIEISQWLLANKEMKSGKTVSLTINPIIFGLNLPVEIRRKRITRRLFQRLENGMIEEVKSLLNQGVPAEKLIFYGLEYKFITQYLIEQIPYNQMVMNLETAIHQFAKRQMTYFRGMERKEMKINWLDATRPTDELLNEIAEVIKGAQ